MSNLAFLAQTLTPTTVPAAPPESSSAIAVQAIVVFVWLGVALAFLLRQKPWKLPAVPRPPEAANAGVLAGVLVSAVAAYFALSVVGVSLLGLTQDIAKTPEGMRQAMQWQPVAQIGAITVVLGLLYAVRAMPGVFQWQPQMSSASESSIPAQASGADPLPLLNYGTPLPQRSLLADARTGLAVWALAIPFVALLGMLIELISRLGLKSPPEHHLIFELWKGLPPGVSSFKIMAFVSAGLLAPIGEELIFRGLILRLLHLLTGQAWLSIVISAILFAAVHNPWTLQPPIFALAIFLAASYFRTGSIFVPIAAHAIFNITQFGLFVLTVA